MFKKSILDNLEFRKRGITREYPSNEMPDIPVVFLPLHSTKARGTYTEFERYTGADNLFQHVDLSLDNPEFELPSYRDESFETDELVIEVRPYQGSRGIPKLPNEFRVKGQGDRPARMYEPEIDPHTHDVLVEDGAPVWRTEDGETLKFVYGENGSGNFLIKDTRLWRENKAFIRQLLIHPWCLNTGGLFATSANNMGYAYYLAFPQLSELANKQNRSSMKEITTFLADVVRESLVTLRVAAIHVGRPAPDGMADFDIVQKLTEYISQSKEATSRILDFMRDPSKFIPKYRFEWWRSQGVIHYDEQRGFYVRNQMNEQEFLGKTEEAFWDNLKKKKPELIQHYDDQTRYTAFMIFCDRYTPQKPTTLRLEDQIAEYRRKQEQANASSVRPAHETISPPPAPEGNTPKKRGRPPKNPTNS